MMDDPGFPLPVQGTLALGVVTTTAVARREDPETSQRAAALLRRDTIVGSQREVLAILADGPGTDHDIRALWGFEYDARRERWRAGVGAMPRDYSIERLRTARHELQRAGLVVGVGTKARRRGHARVWALTAEGYRAVG